MGTPTRQRKRLHALSNRHAEARASPVLKHGCRTSQTVNRLRLTNNTVSISAAESQKRFRRCVVSWGVGGLRQSLDYCAPQGLRETVLTITVLRISPRNFFGGPKRPISDSANNPNYLLCSLDRVVMPQNKQTHTNHFCFQIRDHPNCNLSHYALGWKRLRRGQQQCHLMPNNFLPKGCDLPSTQERENMSSG